MNANRPALFLGLVVLAVATRLIDHPWNIAPVGAIALFAGTYVRNRWAAFVLPIAAMIASDVALGVMRGDPSFYTFHTLLPVVYACYLISVLLGRGVRRTWQVVDDQKNWGTPRRALFRILPLAGATLAGSVIFFVVTNFGVWALMQTYPKTWAGLVECFVRALPFFDNTRNGDILFVIALFGGYELAAKYLPAKSNNRGLLYS